MHARQLLIVSALVETGAGLMLLVSPAPFVALLLGASLASPAAFVVARMAGAALLSLACACWLARNGGPHGGVSGMVVALLLYNSAAVALLAHAAINTSLLGVLTWPTVALHAALAAWCTASLRSGR